jgi:hypothetical protein
MVELLGNDWIIRALISSIGNLSVSS